MSAPAPVSEFACDFDGFKTQATEFFRRLKAGAVTSAQIEAGLHALGLAFIYMTGTPNERYQSEIVLTLAHRHADQARTRDPLMSTILVSTIVRNETRYLDRYHTQLKALVGTQPQHQFLLSIVENDSTDGSAAKLASLDWSFTTAHQLTSGQFRTPPFVGGKHPIRTELLARARNQSIFEAGLLGQKFISMADSVLVIEPDIAYTVETADRIINHEQHYGRRFDIFTPKSVHPGSQNLYDSWGTRQKEAHDDWAQGDGVQDRGLEPLWATFNCMPIYRADAIRAGHTFSGTNPRTKQPDCDTSAICDAFRLAGYGEIYWDTRLTVEHNCE